MNGSAAYVAHLQTTEKTRSVIAINIGIRMKKFSIVLPTKNNISGLLVTLGCFELFTHDKKALEIILVVDIGDKDIVSYKRLQRRYSYDIRVLEVEHTDDFCRGYYNKGASEACGENIMVFNDDCYVHTTKWDLRILERIQNNAHFNGVYLVSLMDSTFNDTPEMPFPRFPMISKKAVDTIGFFFYPQVRMYPADKVIYDLYKAVGCVITCHDVKLQHDHVYTHNPKGDRFMRILQEDRANGVFPVNATEEHRKLHKAITGEDI